MLHQIIGAQVINLCPKNATATFIGVAFFCLTVHQLRISMRSFGGLSPALCDMISYQGPKGALTASNTPTFSASSVSNRESKKGGCSQPPHNLQFKDFVVQISKARNTQHNHQHIHILHHFKDTIPTKIASGKVPLWSQLN